MSETGFRELLSNTFPVTKQVHKREDESSRDSLGVLRARSASCQPTSVTKISSQPDGHMDIDHATTCAIVIGSSGRLSRACTPLVVINGRHSFLTDSGHSTSQNLEITHSSVPKVPDPSRPRVPKTREDHGIQRQSCAMEENSLLDGSRRESGSTSKSVILFGVFLCVVSVCSNISLMMFTSKHQIDLQLRMFVHVQSASDIGIVITNLCILLWISWERYSKDRLRDTTTLPPQRHHTQLTDNELRPVSYRKRANGGISFKRSEE